jgi:Uma2 family endonuclease
MTQTVKKLYTPEEYFALEETADYKSEYYYGEIIPMTGGSINHNRLVRNFVTALDNAFADSDCEVFPSDLRLQVKAGKHYLYPDIMALCGELKFLAKRNDTILNPSVIVEILSKSTRAADQSTKFDDYKEIQSLQNYVLIDQYRVSLECRIKQADGTWQTQTYNDLTQSLKLPAVNADVLLSRLYHKVIFTHP